MKIKRIKLLMAVVLFFLVMGLVTTIQAIKIKAMPSLPLNMEYTQIALGGSHVGVIDRNGEILMWGSGSDGKLGNNNSQNKYEPFNITNFFPELAEDDYFIKIALGGQHSTALTASGRLFTWGVNERGQLGNNSTTKQLIPVEINNQFTGLGNDKIIDVFAGFNNTGAVTQDGKVYMWGFNHYGQVGNKNTTDQLKPVNITANFSGLSGDKVVKLVMGFNHTMALTSGGKLYAWGANGNYQLGTGNQTNQNAPLQITSNIPGVNADKIKEISATEYSSFVLTNNGRLFAWGYNYTGPLGTGGTDVVKTPTETTSRYSLTGGDKLISIQNGSSTTYVLSESGKLFVHGSGNWGQLGNNTNNNLLTPATINNKFTLSTTDKVIAIYGGGGFGLFVTQEGRIFSWGYNANGQTGTGTENNVLVPTEVITLEKVKVREAALLEEAFLEYNDINYSSAKWNNLVAAYQSALNIINNATSKAEVELAKINGINAMGTIIDYETELTVEKANALASINSAFNNYIEDDYTPENWNILVSHKDSAIAEINDTNDLDIVLNEKANVILAMADIKTKTQELQMAKDAATLKINNAFNALNSADYKEEDWADLVISKDHTLQLIDNISIPEEAEDIANDGLAVIESFLTIEEYNLINAKTLANQAVTNIYNSYKEEDYSPENWIAIVVAKESAISKIDNATNIDAITTAKDDGIIAMAAVKIFTVELADVKQAAIDEINNAFNEYNENDYTRKEWKKITAAKDAAIVSVVEASTIADANNSKLNGINEIISTVIELNNHKQGSSLLWLWIMLLILGGTGLIIGGYYACLWLILLNKNKNTNPVLMKDEAFDVNRLVILDYINKMQKDNKKFTKPINLKEKTSEILPDTISADGKAFAMIYEYSNHTRLVLRLEKEYGEKLINDYATVKRSFLNGGEFYDITISKELGNKNNVFNMIEQAYYHTIKRS